MNKIPIRIHPFFWIFSLLIGWLNSGEFAGALIWMAIIFISILVHEAGHAFSAILFGQSVRIELVAFGGLTFRKGPKLPLWKDFLVVLAGPLAGALLFLVAYSIYPLIPLRNNLWHYAVQVTVTVNLVWTILNLIPVQPLDGGRLLGIILEAIFGFKGFKIALVLSVVLGAILSLFFFVSGQLFLGILFSLLAFESYRSTRFINVMSEQDRDESLQTLLQEAQIKKERGDVNEAYKIYSNLQEKTSTGVIHNAAVEAKAQILETEGKKDPNKLNEAYRLLEELPVKSSEVLPLFHRLAFQLQKYTQVVSSGDEVYQIAPTYETALINGMSHAALGQVQPALGWLECACREGVPNLEGLLKKNEFDPIRREPLFQNFIKSLQEKKENGL